MCAGARRLMLRGLLGVGSLLLLSVQGAMTIPVDDSIVLLQQPPKPALKRVSTKALTRILKVVAAGVMLHNIEMIHKGEHDDPIFGFGGDWLKKLEALKPSEKKTALHDRRRKNEEGGRAQVIQKIMDAVNELEADASETRTNSLVGGDWLANASDAKDQADGPFKWMKQIADGIKSLKGMEGGGDWLHRLSDAILPHHSTPEERMRQRRFFDKLRKAVGIQDGATDGDEDTSLFGGDWLDKVADKQKSMKTAEADQTAFGPELLKRLAEAVRGLPQQVEEKPGKIAPVFGGDWLNKLAKDAHSTTASPAYRGPVVMISKRHMQEHADKRHQQQRAEAM